MNDLRRFFESRYEGNGIWKWDHYFEAYDRHFSKFRGTAVNILEIGIYSGGSLEMWLDYFGDQATIYGVDLVPECVTYESERVKVFIGDQSNLAFWEHFVSVTPQMDIVIDDGSHKPRHQRRSFDMLWPHVRPGGVYVCEDVHGYPRQPFAEYIHDLAHDLHFHQNHERDLENPLRNIVNKTNVVQSEISSISLYPYLIAVEKNSEPVAELVCPKRGTTWQPFKP